MRELGSYWPNSFKIGGEPLTKLKPWGAAYERECRLTKGQKDVVVAELFPGASADSQNHIPPYDNPRLPPTNTYCWRKLACTQPATTVDGIKESGGGGSRGKKRLLTYDPDEQLGDILANVKNQGGSKAVQATLIAMVQGLVAEDEDLTRAIQKMKSDASMKAFESSNIENKLRERLREQQDLGGKFAQAKEHLAFYRQQQVNSR